MKLLNVIMVLLRHNTSTTTEHVEHVNVRGLRYNPARGLNLMLGLRYVFGQPKPDPDPDPVVEEVMIQEAPEPVKGLW